MSDQLQLIIPSPCHQSWQGMKSVDTGRFCDHCQNVVVDFSGLTDQQIAEVMNQSTGSACGRFKLSQLNRTIQPPTPASYSPGRFVSLLIAGLLGYQTARTETLPAFAVAITTQTNQYSPNAFNLPTSTKAKLTDPLRVITGRVIEKATNTALSGVNVSIKGSSTGISTDSAGHFKLLIPGEYQGKQVTIVVAMIGFITNEIQLPPDRSDPLSIGLAEDSVALGEVIVTGGYKKLNFFQRLRNRFRSGQ